MEEILEVLEMFVIYCKTSECNKCRFSTNMGKGAFVRYDCNINKLAEELNNCPCYWDLDKVKEILAHD